MTFPLLIALAIPAATPDDPPRPIDVVEALEAATVEAIARARPSVVAIARIRGEEPDRTTAIRGEPPAVDVPAGPDRNPLRLNYAAPGDFSSGVVIGPDNAILTTYHTLRGAAQIWVRSADRKEFEAEILAADPRSDLAVIAPRDLGGNPPPKLTPMKIGDAAKLRTGSFLIALGNPYNAARDGKASAGLGILSNTTRKIHAPPPEEGVGLTARGAYFRYQPTLLQLDAKLNMGMSGGAVVNMRGELVGLTTAAASPVAYDVQAGYAIPMDALGQRIANTLRQGKEVEYGFLGITLSNEVPNRVDDVTKDTPPDRGGLERGDIIVGVGDRDLHEDEEDALTMALALVPAGNEARLKVRRDGQVLEKKVFISKYPVAGTPIATNRPKAYRGLKVDFPSVLGAKDGVLSRDVKELMTYEGVAITDVETGSPADVAGLRPGIIITEIDDQPVRTPAEYAKVMASKEGKAVILTTERGAVSGQKVGVGK